jgi:hypothetical protein
MKEISRKSPYIAIRSPQFLHIRKVSYISYHKKEIEG